ncbi:MAG: M4 family metallopeptidase [Ferruginibacter sp.]
MLHFGAQKYSWQNDAKNNILQNSNTTLPKAELVWVQKDGAIDTYNYNSYILCYKFDIVSSIPFDAKSIFVNASSGKYEKYIQLMAHCNPVSVSTSFYGNRTISTQLLSGTTYRLANDCNTAKLYTVNWPFNTYFQKVGNTWLDDSLRAAATSLWGLEQTYSYFKNTHYYNSWDNQNGDIYSYENALFCNTANCTPNNPNNASFYRGTMKVGWGSSGLFDDWNSLDIIAHEFTHGISDTMAHLVYQNESGALNESFSDIFGNTVQLDVLGNVANVWQIGEDRTNFSGGSSAPIRDMANPNNYFDPDTYLGTYWQNFATNTNDLGGVHTNSGVQNYMYYLLAVGDNGTNDLGNYFAVEGIGITNARRIAFKALVDYFLPNSTHQDARTAWLSAAEDLFGIFSQEYKQVANAWYAVGVCSNSGNELLADCGTITAYSDKIFYGFKYIFLGLCGNQTINPASNIVSYKAGTIITLMPGFTATQGSNFRASIVDCVPQ